MPLNNPLSLSLFEERGGRPQTLVLFFSGSQIFVAVDGLPPWESDRETSYFGDASDRRFIREIFPFALSSLSLKREEITESLRVSSPPLSTPSYFDFSRFKYCTMYILWFAHREKEGNMYILRLLFLRVSNAFFFFFSRKS